MGPWASALRRLADVVEAARILHRHWPHEEVVFFNPLLEEDCVQTVYIGISRD